MFVSGQRTSQSVFRTVRGLPTPIYDLVVIHTRNVRDTALQMGIKLGLNPHEQSVLRLAAIAHDLAKTFPKFRSLFLLPGALDEAQSKEAAKHALASAIRLLQVYRRGKAECDFDIIAPAVFMIAGHHWNYLESREKYEELKSHKIFAQAGIRCEETHIEYLPILGARVLKVADSFVTSMEHRHYLQRPNFTNYHDAFAGIKAQVRTKYAPNAVGALKEVLLDPRSRRKLSYLKGQTS